MKFKLIDNKRLGYCLAFISQLNFETVWEVEVKPYKKKRTLPQNSAYWGVWLKTIVAAKGHSPRAWHEFFKKQFLPVEIVEVNGVVLEIQDSTTKLTTKEFSEFIEHVHEYSVNELGVSLPTLLSDEYD